jgi:hypothetical protein
MTVRIWRPSSYVWVRWGFLLRLMEEGIHRRSPPNEDRSSVGRRSHEHPPTGYQVPGRHLGRALPGSSPPRAHLRPQADAERFVRHQLDTDQYLDPESARITVRDWAERWRPTVEHSERAPSTISGYESALRLHVLPRLGDRRLRTLRRIDMEEWLSSLRTAGYANSTIHSARTVLGMVLTSAMDARIIAGNPLTGLRLPKGSRRTRNALTVEQVEALADAVDPLVADVRARPGLLQIAPRGGHSPPAQAPRRSGPAYRRTGHD